MSDRLQEIRARLDAATPGPWEVLEESFDWTSVRTSDYTGSHAVVYSDEGRTVHRADADLIAHAPADIAWLLAENEAFREQIGFLREHIAHVHGYAHHRTGCASIADADVIHDTPCDCGLDVEDA